MVPESVAAAAADLQKIQLKFKETHVSGFLLFK